MKAHNFARVTFSASDLTERINETLAVWQHEDKVQALWDSDSSLWTNGDEAQWTGWLTAAQEEMGQVGHILRLAQELQTAGCTDLVLLGICLLYTSPSPRDA